ncbi:plasmid partitioning/stability family protein [Ferrimonas sp. SCSIO 43195]|uniref:plasmid partitioning/stability family protein n=1 Tax=Ferrimonas sp. SCSIO 43195 TaxID=2822844 RepID=UPI002074F1D8|nr:plasmid partitioning/stability family protein [Ferrimonas sp. SCSIO 43195]USD38013.1 hypothetical protein J8Z22_02265 [Ferrimonas sp. SCSIO 43195]
MRIRCSFTLEPELHGSHQYAVDTLRQWQQQEKGRGDSNEVAQLRRNGFHRDLYLSGLFLQQLSPQLPAMLAQALVEERLQGQTLTQLLAASGVSVDSDGGAGLSEGQWTKLTSMLKTSMAAPKASTEVNLAPLQQQLEQLANRPQPAQSDSNLSGALAQLEQQQQQILAQLQQLASQGNSTPTAQPDAHVDLGSQFVALKQGQDKLMAQLKALRSQISSGSVTPTAADAEAPSLDTQLALASKVKSKGIW